MLSPSRWASIKKSSSEESIARWTSLRIWEGCSALLKSFASGFYQYSTSTAGISIWWLSSSLKELCTEHCQAWALALRVRKRHQKCGYKLTLLNCVTMCNGICAKRFCSICRLSVSPSTYAVDASDLAESSVFALRATSTCLKRFPLQTSWSRSECLRVP